MDYGYQGIKTFKDLNKHTFYIRNGMAYNVADYGNYLWGRGMALLGINVGVASFGAHFNNFRSKLFGNTDSYPEYNLGKGTYGEPDWFDSPADQRAIIRGSQSVTGTYKPKPFTWPTNSFILK